MLDFIKCFSDARTYTQNILRTPKFQIRTFQKVAKDLNRYFTERERYKISQYRHKVLNILIREIKIKILMSYPYTCIRMAKI